MQRVRRRPRRSCSGTCPLVDVHEHAELAAEAAEAAAAQGRFWEMHDRALRPPGRRSTTPTSSRYAAELGLDVDRFGERPATAAGTRCGSHRDVASADDSGAAGTPTFFINGRRHHGGHDLASLAATLQQELDRTAG